MGGKCTLGVPGRIDTQIESCYLLISGKHQILVKRVPWNIQHKQTGKLGKSREQIMFISSQLHIQLARASGRSRVAQSHNQPAKV